MTSPGPGGRASGAGSPAAPAAWRLRRYEALASTSDLCASLAEAGEPEGAAVLALRQTGGRGTRGRGWVSPPGALALSVLLRPRGRMAEAGQWALLAAVAFAEALTRHAPSPEAEAAIRLKWPNDVLLGGRKLGGILIDAAAGESGSLGWLVIGFGANLGASPELDDREAAGLGSPAVPEEAAASLLERLDHWRRVRLLEGFAPVRRAWLDRAHPPGTHLRVRVGGQELGGAFAGLSDDGALLLQANGRVHAFHTGEVLQAGAGR